MVKHFHSGTTQANIYATKRLWFYDDIVMELLNEVLPDYWRFVDLSKKFLLVLARGPIAVNEAVATECSKLCRETDSLAIVSALCGGFWGSPWPPKLVHQIAPFPLELGWTQVFIFPLPSCVPS